MPAKLQPMNPRIFLAAALSVVLCSNVTQAQPSPAATAAFNVYVSQVEAQLTSRHGSPATFLAADSRVRSGDLVIEEVKTASPPGSLLHHWRGTAFAPGASAADFDRLLRNFDSYPRQYAPQVLAASVLSGSGDHLQAYLRVRQKHVLTVVLDSTYDITFARLDPAHRYSFSRSTRISEIDAAGTPRERILNPAEEHGFLWRLNTYWTWEERDGGLYLQIDTVSLSRSIPVGLAWAVRPFVERVPRESLEFTLRSAVNALRKH